MNNRYPFSFKALCWALLAVFLITTIYPSSYAYAQLAMPKPGQMVALSSAFAPALLKGVKIYPHDPFRLDFIIDKGDGESVETWHATSLHNDATRLIKYFLASVTVPEKDLWVNLSPYEKERITPEAFGRTEMGRDLLAQDYILKQITASVLYPESDLGKEFWAKVYKAAQEKYGTTDIPVDTFNKVWIVPEKATVYEAKDAAYVVESRLKVMLDIDYVAETVLEPGSGQRNVSGPEPGSGLVARDVLRSVIVPVLEKEVNEGKNFAQLRQVYNSLILATWYKDRIKESLLGKAYVERSKVAGVDIADKSEKEKIWARYVIAFKKGVYNYIKEDTDPVTNEPVARKYISGGAGMDKIRQALRFTTDKTMLPEGVSDNAEIVRIGLDAAEDVVVLKGGKDRRDILTSEAPVELVDEQGNILHQKAGYYEAHEKGLWHMAAHVYFTYKGKVLLQRRSLTKATAGGKLQVSASGHVDFDETPQIAAIREAGEETGLTIDPKRLVQVTGPNAIKRSNPSEIGINNEFTTVFFYAITDEELQQVQDNYNLNEIAEFLLMPFETFEEKIAQAPEEFSGSLKYIIKEGADIYASIKSLALAGVMTKDAAQGRQVSTGLQKLRNWAYAHRHETVNTSIGKVAEKFGVQNSLAWRVLKTFEITTLGTAGRDVSNGAKKLRVWCESHQGQAVDTTWVALGKKYGLSAVHVGLIAHEYNITTAGSAKKASKEKGSKDFAQKGGIDLTRDRLDLKVKSSEGPVQFDLDPVMMEKLQNAPGFTPVILDILPMTISISAFLGLQDK